MSVDCEDGSGRNIITKYFIIRTAYVGRRTTPISVYEVRPYNLGEYFPTYLVRYGQILNATSDDMNGGWSFGIRVARKAFSSVPNWLDVENQKMPVIVCSRKKKKNC